MTTREHGINKSNWLGSQRTSEGLLNCFLVKSDRCSTVLPTMILSPREVDKVMVNMYCTIRQWRTASGTWFGETSRQSQAEPVKQQHTGISPNHVPEAVRHCSEAQTAETGKDREGLQSTETSERGQEVGQGS